MIKPLGRREYFQQWLVTVAAGFLGFGVLCVLGEQVWEGFCVIGAVVVWLATMLEVFLGLRRLRDMGFHWAWVILGLAYPLSIVAFKIADKAHDFRDWCSAIPFVCCGMFISLVYRLALFFIPSSAQRQWSQEH